jgi:CarD family transcriptional regulator
VNCRVTREQKMATEKKTASRKLKYKIGEFVVYPAHGVGKIVALEEQEIAGSSLELFVIDFEKDKMRLRVPLPKCDSVGMRKLSDKTMADNAMKVLTGKARVKRTMWSRRAQEYEAKINSGDLISVAEVVRDLYRSDRQPEQSYSERQLYESALDRMAREIACVRKLDDAGAVSEIEAILEKASNIRGEKAAAAAEEKAA